MISRLFVSLSVGQLCQEPVCCVRTLCVRLLCQEPVCCVRSLSVVSRACLLCQEPVFWTVVSGACLLDSCVRSLSVVSGACLLC